MCATGSEIGGVDEVKSLPDMSRGEQRPTGGPEEDYKVRLVHEAPRISHSAMQANSSIWFDVSAFPHIVDEIVCEAPPDVLTSFRGVSRRFRAFVDDMTAYHLILEGVSSTILPAAALHNGECILLRSRSECVSPY